MRIQFKLKFEHTLCLLILLSVVSIIQFAGLRAISTGKIGIDYADECAYFNAAQTYLMDSAGKGDYLWEVFHSFKSNLLKHKAPGTQLVSIPIILAQNGTVPTTLRQFSFLWMIPAAFLLYWGLCTLVRPVSAMIAVLIFILSQTTIMTFSHWYQEMTAIPAVCMAIAVFCYEIKKGGSGQHALSWLPLGVLLGLGMYSKISYVFIFIWLWAALYVASEALPETKMRRSRLLKEGVTAYCVASFWWPTHFLYAVKYMTGGYAKHGAITNSIAERLFLFLKSDFIYMYGIWLLVLFAVVVGLVCCTNWERMVSCTRLLKWNFRSGILFLATLAIVISAIIISWHGLMKTVGVFALAGLCLLTFYSLVKRNQFRLSGRFVGFLVVLFPLFLICIQRITGNNFFPRVSSVVIPLMAGVVAFLFDSLLTGKGLRSNRFKAGLLCAVFVMFALQGLALSGRNICMSGTSKDYFLTPFDAASSMPDYSVLSTVAKLPETENMKLGYAGNGNISPHALKRAYYPHVNRVECVNLMNLLSEHGYKKIPEIAALVDAALLCDIIVVPNVDDTVVFEGITPASVQITQRENALNMPLVRMLSTDPRFSLLFSLDNKKGCTDGFYVFRVIH